MIGKHILCLLLGLAALPAGAWSPQELWQAWPDSRFTTTVAPCLRHNELRQSLQELTATYAGRVRLEEIGRSFLGRPIEMLSLGSGEQTILLWSQMHGDEPSATPALLDVAHYLLSQEDDESAQAILERFTLLLIPMLNPDGSEIYERRNAQAIDINRDALNLATPEGRVLKEIRDRYQPLLGFNLHDQNRRTAVGDSGVLATNAVLAVSGDPEGTLTPGRMRAKRACSAIISALAPFMPGGMARYDEDWSPRAFGDNLTAWGTPVVLIESGGLPPDQEFSALSRLNFVALLAVLQDLARDDLAGHDPQLYEDLPRNRSDSWAEIVVRGGHLLQPGDPEPYRADLAIYLFRDDREQAGCGVGKPVRSGIFEIGDARFIGGGRDIDAADSALVSPFVIGIERWSARRWLSAELLLDLAKLGVGSVRWSVPARKLAKAEALADALNRAGGASLAAIPEASSQPAVMLRQPPDNPGSRNLVDILGVLQAIDPRSTVTAEGVVQALQSLWPDDLTASPELPVIRRGQPASFLMLRPAPAGQIDASRTRLEAVWLDGVEIEQAP